MPDVPASPRRRVVSRAGGRCEYCRLAQIGQEATFHVDHITPRAAAARNTYVVPSVAEALKTSSTPRTFRSALAGEVKETNTVALLDAEIEGRPISTHALVVDRIGNDEHGIPIAVLFGTLATQQWGIRPVPDEVRLDLSDYPEESVEF